MAMDEGRLTSALDRAERARARIERSVAHGGHGNGKDQELRTKVREAVAELDQIIRMAENA
jgi:predicted ABC-type ATPase